MPSTNRPTRAVSATANEATAILFPFLLREHPEAELGRFQIRLDLVRVHSFRPPIAPEVIGDEILNPIAFASLRVYLCNHLCDRRRLYITPLAPVGIEEIVGLPFEILIERQLVEELVDVRPAEGQR